MPEKGTALGNPMDLTMFEDEAPPEVPVLPVATHPRELEKYGTRFTRKEVKTTLDLSDMEALLSDEWIPGTLINVYLAMFTRAESARLVTSGPCSRNTVEPKEWQPPSDAALFAGNPGMHGGSDTVYFADTYMCKKLRAESEIPEQLPTHEVDPQFWASMAMQQLHIMTCRFIFIPQNVNNVHWVFWLVDLGEKLTDPVHVTLYDSTLESFTSKHAATVEPRARNIVAFLNYMARAQGQPRTYKYVIGYDNPPQDDDFSCGVFVMRAAADLHSARPKLFPKYIAGLPQLLLDYKKRYWAASPPSTKRYTDRELRSVDITRPGFHHMLRLATLPQLWRVILGKILYDWYYLFPPFHYADTGIFEYNKQDEAETYAELRMVHDQSMSNAAIAPLVALAPQHEKWWRDVLLRCRVGLQPGLTVVV